MMPASSFLHREELDQLAGVTNVLGGDLDDEHGYCVECWCEIDNHGYPRRCAECCAKSPGWWTS